MDSRTTSESISSASGSPLQLRHRRQVVSSSSEADTMLEDAGSDVSTSLNRLAEEATAKEAGTSSAVVVTTLPSGEMRETEGENEGPRGDGEAEAALLVAREVPFFEPYQRPSAEDFRSSATEERLVSCVNGYFVPAEYDLRLPGVKWSASLSPVGYAAVYDLHFVYGLRFPLLPLVVDILRHYRIALAQLVPNAILTVVGFALLSHKVGVEASLIRFRYYYQIQKAHKSTVEWYTFYPRFPGLKLVLDAKSSNKEW